jgi:hypothetical protein
VIADEDHPAIVVSGIWAGKGLAPVIVGVYAQVPCGATGMPFSALSRVGCRRTWAS